MSPYRALFLAAFGEFLGPLLLGTAVAHTMSTSILKPEALGLLSPEKLYLMISCGVGGAIAWKLPTWLLGLPSSGSHALIGGLVGAGAVALGYESISIEKVLGSVVVPLLFSPLVGIFLGFLIFAIIRNLFSRAHRGIGRIFASLQKPTVLFLAASHGSNDAQKSMGVMAIVLAFTPGESYGEFNFPSWVTLSCTSALVLGLLFGGWRIVKTVGLGICRMEPVHSFASQLASTLVVTVASITGGPVSTTQVVASSVMGVGASRRLSGVKWSAATSIAYAWLLTFPVSAGFGAGLFWIFKRLLTSGEVTYGILETF
jgi:PiT family inorganic phosphate transporter